MPPSVEHLLGLVCEPHSGDAFFIFTTSTKVFCIQAIEPLEDLVGSVLRLGIWPAVHVPPGWGRVWPDQQLEALQQAIVALLSLGGLVDVGRERSGLDAA